jgi:electron transfer flavoprotein alpha subunit
MAARITDKCIGCAVCADTCPYSAIEIFEGMAVVSGHCTFCGACAEVCPVGAIEMEGRASEGLGAQDVKAWNGICVFAEAEEDGFTAVAFELLNEAKTLSADLDQPVAAIAIGSGLKDKASQLIAAGADKVYLVDDPAMAAPLIEPYTRVLVDLISKYKPAVLLAGATSFGRSVMPAVAAILETGLTADCTALAVDPETKLIRQTRPTFGGNLMATIVCPERRPQMATVRPHVFKRGSLDENRQGEIIEAALDKAVFSSVTRLVSKEKELAGGVKLEDAEVIVAGGRGMGGPDNLELLNELARLFKGAVGATRPLVDEGWLPYVHQVGQTGKTVGPKLYMACGISGAVQHTAGMSTSEIVVAINSDPDAPIFQCADYALVGDVKEILPALIERIKAEQA